jgi:hypothetical protein
MKGVLMTLGQSTAMLIKSFVDNTVDDDIMKIDIDILDTVVYSELRRAVEALPLYRQSLNKDGCGLGQIITKC